MKSVLSFFFLVILFSCKQSPPAKKTVAAAAPRAAAPAAKLNYDSCKNCISRLRLQNKTRWSQLPSPEKEKIFTTAVAETILPNWVGTPWSFYGTSEKPGEGSIACGYFVTTVLRDAGLKIARAKLAQCASEEMITSLMNPRSIRRFSNIPLENFISSISATGYGIYVVGLDNHTGFIYHDGRDIWFIHSTYVGTRNVMKEKAAESWVLRQSRYKVLGKLSSDTRVLDNWIHNTSL